MLIADPPSLDDARTVLRETFGYADFRSGQARVIEAVLAGRDMLAVMPTGAGKSLCYQIPALTLGGLTIVVSPLLALIDDQVSALRLAGVAADSITSMHDRETNIAAWRRVQAGETRLLYLSPERLMTDRMLAALARLPVSLLAIDEAHCMAQWGPSFRPDYAALKDLKRHFPDVPILALTATADAVTREDIVDALFGGDAESFVAGFDRPNIHLACAAKDKPRDQLLSFVAQHRGVNGIVYCLSRKGVEKTAQLLVDQGYNALAYHAGLEAEDRRARQDRFMTESDLVMVATIAFGMGIDKPDIRFVFHADLPASLEAYYQEIGRAGRDGAPARAMMLYGLDDVRTRRRFIAEENMPDEAERRAHRRLDALLAYAAAPDCRRHLLMAYFGEAPADEQGCGTCDLCDDPEGRVEAGDDARLVLDTARRTGERFGAAHLVDILRGSSGARIIDNGHDRLPGYGMGAERSAAWWRDLILQMTAARLLSLDVAGYGGLSLTPRGRRLLQGGEFLARTPALLPKVERRPAAKAPAPESSDVDPALFAELKALRLDLARAREVPAYVIFHDSTLMALAAARPQSLEDMRGIPGIGARKLAAFGNAFLEVIRRRSG